jgi:hypothetical protein
MKQQHPVWRSKSTALGSSHDFVGQLLTATQVQRAPWLLVDGNCQELFPELAGVPGAWVLTSQATILTPFGGAGQQVVPLICTIDFGSGGASQRCQVDVFPGFTLQLPSTTIKASIDWEDLPVATVPGVDLFRIPPLVRVTASIARGQCLTGARRSFLLTRDSGNPTTTLGLVPPFAKSVGFYSQVTHQGFVNAGSYLRLRSGTPAAAGVIVSEVYGPQLLTQQQTGRELVVPGHSACWQMHVAAADATVGRVDFLVRL